VKDQDETMDLSEEDWTLIIEGTRSIHYKKDVHVIMQGQSEIYRLFQISKGACRIEKTNVDEVIVLAKAQSGEIFGEIAFLEGSSATASVVADEEDTVIHVIEGFYLDILFDYYPGMSGRFYHFLATVLSGRLKMRENAESKRKKETESEESLQNSKDDFGTKKLNRPIMEEPKKRTKSLRPLIPDNKKKEKKERKKRISKVSQPEKTETAKSDTEQKKPEIPEEKKDV